jgi:hypothetical protein
MATATETFGSYKTTLPMALNDRDARLTQILKEVSDTRALIEELKSEAHKLSVDYVRLAAILDKNLRDITFGGGTLTHDGFQMPPEDFDMERLQKLISSYQRACFKLEQLETQLDKMGFAA